jgi:ATP-binding cassette subfamily F protein 3
VILVSHDRAFLRELSTRVWAFDGDRLEDYGGPFVEWEAHAADRARRRAAIRQREEAAAPLAARDGVRRQADTRREEEQALRAARRSAEASEREVHRLETRIEELELTLADPAMYDGSGEAARRAGELDRELGESRRALDQALTRWTEAVESLGQPARSE